VADGKAMMAWQRTNNYGGGGAIMALPPTANNNQLYAQQRTSINCKMRWRTMAAEETRWMEKQQWYGNGQSTTVGGGEATRMLTTMTTKQQSINVQWQRRRMKMAGKR
jgi:hypothetical protein